MLLSVAWRTQGLGMRLDTVNFGHFILDCYSAVLCIKCCWRSVCLPLINNCICSSPGWLVPLWDSQHHQNCTVCKEGREGGEKARKEGREGKERRKREEGKEGWQKHDLYPGGMLPWWYRCYLGFHWFNDDHVLNAYTKGTVLIVPRLCVCVWVGESSHTFSCIGALILSMRPAG